MVQLPKPAFPAPAAVKNSPRKRIAIMLELQSPYRRHAEVYAGIQQYALEHGKWDCIIDEFADVTLKKGTPRNPPYDGVIARVPLSLARQTRRLKVPVVNVWANSPAWPNLPCVLADPEAIGKSAAEHLLERGFRRFACLSAVGDRQHQGIIVSFHQIIRNAGFKCQCATVSHGCTESISKWNAFYKKIGNWIKAWQPPVGVLIPFADNVGRLVTETCRNHNVLIPQNAALIICDDEPAMCLYPPPTLTSVDIPYRRMGFAAADLLEQLMLGKNPQPLNRYLPPTGIVARQSTDFFAVDDPLIEASLRFISKNMRQPIQVDQVCEGVTTVRRTLERRFRAVLGRTVAQEIVRLRLECAKRELAASNMSIKTISERAGFVNLKTMYQIFKRELKLSPSQYRELHQRKSMLGV